MSLRLFAAWSRGFRAVLLVSLFWLILVGCEASDHDQSRPPLDYDPPIVSLGVTGYNYTNQEIDEFFVNGRGGGNVGVSSPTSGGGGTVCCVPYVVGNVAWIVRVRWQSGGCNYHVKSTISDEVHEHIHWFFREADVKVDTPKIKDPKYLEIHFYPDGSVKAGVTERAGGPRLKLPKEREDRKPYPQCPNDKEPAN
jgi:hypothetical protein